MTVSSLEPIRDFMASCFKLGHFLALAIVGVAVLIGQMNDGFDRLEPLTLDAAQDHNAVLTNALKTCHVCRKKPKSYRPSKE